MKHYIDIQKVRTEDIVIDDTLTLERNTDAFYVGDIISITEKIDGANASIMYDKDTDALKAFSSRNELDFSNQLRGFLPYVQSLDKTIFKKYPDCIFFGEWLVSHTVRYEKDNYNKWYVFSVYNSKTKRWLLQDFVKSFAKENGFLYPHELYYGPFISWEHCLSFANKPYYGDRQEGIVIKNQTALMEGRGPHVLKYVNDSFKETQYKNHRNKIEDPNKIKTKAEAEEYIRMIVTDARVVKMLHKLVDEGILPEKITPKDMQIVAKNLPKRIYEDCVKEENEILQKAGEYGGIMCNKVTMNIAKKLLLG